MAFSLEANRYLAVYGEWTRWEDDDRYANWATERMVAMQAHAVGIQLADENLGKRPALFMKEEHLARLDSVRNKYDPQALFRSWMARPDR
jgi:hypothetical protein